MFDDRNFRTSDQPLAAWQQAWRGGIARQLSLGSLLALRSALESDSHELAQGITTHPPALISNEDHPMCAACVLALAIWRGEGLETVGQVDERFNQICAQAGQYLGDPAGAGYFLNWVDGTPRDEMRAQLLEEVRFSIAEREPAEELAAA